MNKKQLIIAAMATVLSVSVANANSTISGITNGGSGTFDINPEKVNGGVAYRAYNQFEVGSGDKANLIYQWASDPNRDINTFINLVQNGVNIEGALNTVRNGSFYNGHAVFISPNGLTVGASGVLNVGRLSVATPSTDTFNKLMSEYNATTFKPEHINQLSKLKHVGDEDYQSGHAAINVKGYIFSRNGVDLPGSNINVSGKIVNGLNYSDTINSESVAQRLFTNLVNTDGTINADRSEINSNGSLVFLNSHNNGGATDGINVSGYVVNLGNGDTNTTNDVSVALTSAGRNGINVSGHITADGKLSVFNKKGDMNISGKLLNKNGELSLTNSANASAMNITSAARLNNTKGDVNIINNGTGALSHAGNATAAGYIDIVNDSNGSKSYGLTVSGANNANNVRIVNRAGKLTFNNSASAKATDSVSIRNWGSSGMQLDGTATAEYGGVLVDNYQGDANVNGDISSEYSNVAVVNRSGAGKLTTNGSIEAKGFVALKNESSYGAELNGDISSSDGEIAINNTAGDMVVNGAVEAHNNNLGINNYYDKDTNKTGRSLTLGDNADIIANGEIKIGNTGNGGLTINEGASVANNSSSSNSGTYVYNDAGKLTVNGDISNNAGNLYVASRKNATGLTTGANSAITNDNGIIEIKQKVGTTGDMDLNGKVANYSSNGYVAINNRGTGNMNVSGEVSSKTNLGIINRAEGRAMNVDANITASGDTTNIKNFGSGNMTVAGEINHTGRLNVLGNNKAMTLSGTIQNNGSNMTYAASRANGTGLTATSSFNAQATNGDILIKNITGSNGLDFAGTINSTNKQAEVYNKAGSMTIANTANVSGNKAFILNGGTKGDNRATGLTVNSKKLPSNIMIVNKGSEDASNSIPSQYKNSNNFRQQLRTNN